MLKTNKTISVIVTSMVLFSACATLSAMSSRSEKYHPNYHRGREYQRKSHRTTIPDYRYSRRDVKIYSNTCSRSTYRDNRDGTFTDPRSGLIWRKVPYGRGYTWTQTSRRHKPKNHVLRGRNSRYGNICGRGCRGKCRHKHQTKSSGNVRFRFKNGSVDISIGKRFPRR